MMISVAALVVLLAGLYLVVLGTGALLFPAGATRFLGAFARSRAVHLVELALRLAVGAAMLSYAPHLRFAGLFTAAGWVLVATTLVLFAVPWPLHRRFARWSVPRATRRPRLLGAASLVLGALVLYAVLAGPAAVPQSMRTQRFSTTVSTTDSTMLSRHPLRLIRIIRASASLASPRPAPPPAQGRGR